jgi:hypothetical protein
MSNHDLGPIVTDMLGASVTEDGQVAEMELLNSDGLMQVIRFSPTLFISFVNRVFQLFANERIKMGLQSGHIESQPIPVSVAVAQETVGGEKIILGVKMENGLPVDFSLDSSEAEILHKQLGKAIKKANKQKSAARH